MDEAFIGLIQLFPYRFAPVNWTLCDGKQLSIQQNQYLYSLIGFQFGGDGKTYFNVPNLTNAAPIANVQYYICLNGDFPTRQ